MNHHFDTQIQTCINKDSRVCGVRAFGVRRFTKDILEWILKYNSQETGMEIGNRIEISMQYPYDVCRFRYAQMKAPGSLGPEVLGSRV